MYLAGAPAEWPSFANARFRSARCGGKVVSSIAIGVALNDQADRECPIAARRAVAQSLDPQRTLRRPAWMLLSGVAFLLSGCGRDGLSFMFPFGIVAASQREWFFDIVGLVAIVVVPTFVLVPAFAWRYRRKNTKAAYRPEWSFSWPLEFAIWGIPFVIVGVLVWIILTKERRFDPYAQIPSAGTPLQVQVVALNWKWLFIYPEQHIATVGHLVIPQGRTVSFRLTSDATMQSFFIPALGSQIYAMAGMVTQLHLRADKLGTLLGENTQFNGTGFSGDKFTVSVVPLDQFATWVETTGQNGDALGATAYQRLETDRSVTRDGADFHLPAGSKPTFASVQPGLFDAIVAKYRNGGPMPAPLRTQ